MSDTWFIVNQVSLIFDLGQLIFQLPDMLICAEDQTHSDTGKPQYSKQECRAAAFSGAKQVYQNTFCEYDGTAEIYTYNTNLKKRLTAYAATYPDLCQLTEDDGNSGLRFEIDKRRVSIRLIAPYFQERKNAASQQAAKNNTPSSSIYAA